MYDLETRLFDFGACKVQSCDHKIVDQWEDIPH